MANPAISASDTQSPDAAPFVGNIELKSRVDAPGKLAIAGVILAVFETSLAKMRVYRVPEYLGAALMLGLLGTLLLFVSRGGLR